MKKGAGPLNPPSAPEPATAAEAEAQMPPVLDKAVVVELPPGQEGDPVPGAEGEAPKPPPMTEAEIKVEKDKIDAMFEAGKDLRDGAPAKPPDFREDPAIQGELMPETIPEEHEYEDTITTPIGFEEKAAMFDEVSRIRKLQLEVELEKASFAKDCNEKIKSYDSQINELVEQGEKGEFSTKVRLVKRIDRVKGVCTIFRKSDWKIIDERPLDLKERQIPMDLRAPAKNNVTAGPWSFPRFDKATLASFEAAAILAEALKKVEGVTSVVIYGNNESEKDEAGRPVEAMEIFVDGGKDLSIAAAILDAKPGANLIGARSCVYRGIEIKFSRPRDGFPGHPADPDGEGPTADEAGGEPEEGATIPPTEEEIQRANAEIDAEQREAVQDSLEDTHVREVADNMAGEDEGEPPPVEDPQDGMDEVGKDD